MSRNQEGDNQKVLVELAAARRDLLAMLERLDPADWDKPTLCEGWRVRDVVAHVAWAPDITLFKAMPRMLKARGGRDRFLDELARTNGDREPGVILEHLRSNIESRRIPPRSTHASMLVDTVVHTLDICQPNGWDVEFPADRAKLALSTMVKLGRPFGGRERAQGLHLDTTNIDWRCGCGDHVRGVASVMLLALAGRPVCDQLKGDGVPTLANRG